MSNNVWIVRALVRQISPQCIKTHYMIHRETPLSIVMCLGWNIVLTTVVTVVNLTLLFYCEARIAISL